MKDKKETTRKKAEGVMIEKIKKMNKKELGKTLFFIQNIGDVEISFESDEIPKFTIKDKIVREDKKDEN